MPTFCFLSGLCSQSPPTRKRIASYVVNLVIPTLLWVQIMQPIVFPSIFALSTKTFVERCSALLHGSFAPFFGEPWYLPALIIWRASAFSCWWFCHPLVVIAGSIFFSCWAGYYDYHNKLNETFGYIPYFAVGYVFPYLIVRRKVSACSGASRIFLTIFVLMYMCALQVCLSVYGLRLPDPHLPYSQSDSELAGSTLFWTYRVTRLVVDLGACVPLLFFCFPREHTFVTTIGQRTLYVYLLHPFGNAALAKMTGQYLPGAGSPLLQVLCLFGYFAGEVLVLFVCSSTFVTWVFSGCLSPRWATPLVKLIVCDKIGRAHV